MSLADLIPGILEPDTPILGDFNHVAGTATLQELVYFGAGWTALELFVEGTEALVLRNGWANPVVHRATAGEYYAGVVEKLDDTGRVTDVVLSFQGFQVDAETVLGTTGVILGAPVPHIQRGIDLYEDIFHDPRYQDAKIHIVGYSMGTVNTAWIMAHSLATYGETITDQRTDFTSFAPARYHDQATTWYGLDADVFNGRWTNYQAANDENRDPNHAVPGVPYDYVGTEIILPALVGPNAPFDVHVQNHLMIALGLPDWLTLEEQNYLFESAGQKSAIGYTLPGLAELVIEGDDAGTTLTGLGANDIISGGLGRDILIGNGGNDVFRFDTLQDSGQSAETADRIRDFSAGDTIDLSLLDAIHIGMSEDLVNEDFTFIGKSQFTDAGQVRYSTTKDATWIHVNTDDDAFAEMIVQLDGRHSLTAGDFIL